MKKTLWLLELAGQVTGRLILFYAADENEAETRASDYELDHNAKRRDLRQFKHGFTIVHSTLPGSIEIAEDRPVKPVSSFASSLELELVILLVLQGRHLICGAVLRLIYSGKSIT